MRRTLFGLVLDSAGFWLFLATLTLFAFLMWGATLVQNHYYFPTAPYTYEGKHIR